MKNNLFFGLILVAMLLISGCTSSGTPKAVEEKTTQPTTTPTTQPTTQEAPKKVTDCINDDGVCPDNCGPITDNDCKAFGLGTTVQADKNIKITVSDVNLETCTSDYSEAVEAYLTFHLRAVNEGSSSSNIGSHSFYLLDPDRRQIDGSLLSYPISFSGNCENAKIGSFDGGNLQSGSMKEGKVWIEVSKDGTYSTGQWKIIYKPLMATNPNTFTVYEVTIN